MILNRWPIKVVIFEDRGGSIFLKSHDVGRRIFNKDTGDYYYELKKKKVKTPPVSYDSIYLRKKGKGKKKEQIVYLYGLTPFTYIPLILDEKFAQALYNNTISKQDLEELIPHKLAKLIKEQDTSEFKIKLDDSWIYWLGQQLKTNLYRTQFKSTLERFLPIILIVVLGIVIGLMLHLIIGQMSIITSSNEAVMQKQLEITQMQLEIMRIIGATPTIAPPGV